MFTVKSTFFVNALQKKKKNILVQVIVLVMIYNVLRVPLRLLQVVMVTIKEQWTIKMGPNSTPIPKTHQFQLSK